MKKTYISPSVKCSTMVRDGIMLSTSPGSISYGGTGDGSDEAIKGNTGDDQSTPWYRQ